MNAPALTAFSTSSADTPLCILVFSYFCETVNKNLPAVFGRKEPRIVEGHKNTDEQGHEPVPTSEKKYISAPMHHHKKGLWIPTTAHNKAQKLKTMSSNKFNTAMLTFRTFAGAGRSRHWMKPVRNRRAGMSSMS
jgi:hypothetical protein